LGLSTFISRRFSVVWTRYYTTFFRARLMTQKGAVINRILRVDWAQGARERPRLWSQPESIGGL
jgi:hypothetical protein